jgi:hypothetical protein
LDKPTKASSVTTSSGWNAIFTPTAPSENWKLHTYMLGSSGTQIIKLDAPAMRRIGNAPFVCVRRNGNQNVYIAVHHGTTKTQSSRITGIQSVSSTNSNVIAFKVTFDNGRTDTIISGETPTSSATIDDRISFTGSFGHLAENTAPDGSTPVNNQWAYLVDGSQFVVGDLSITGNVSHSGTITSINRMESGAIDNSFITNSSISSNFNNYTLLVDPTNLQRYAYTIDSIVGTSNSKVKITGEPGLSITGSTIKQEYFPNWGSTGTVQYRIPGSALMIKNTTTNQWDFTGTGSAVGVAPPTFTLKTAANSKQYFELTNITNPKSISSSSNSFACLVTQTGKVYCFGRNSSNQCTIPSNVGTIDKISCGYAHTLALRTDGTIVAWGSDSAKQGKTGTEAIQAQITAAGRTVTKISAGAEHNLALLDNGSVVAWGKNEAAQLSDPDTYWTSINQFGASWPGGYQTQASDTFKYYQDRSTRWTGSAGSEIRIYRCGYYGDNKRYTGCESPNVSTSLSHYLYSNVGGAAGNPVAPSTLVRIASYPTGWTPYTGAPYDYQFSRATTNDPTSVNYGGGGWTRNGLYSALGTSTKTYTDIAAGRSHNLLLASDGKIETWGDNYYYQITGTGPFLADNRTGFGIRTDDNTKYTYTNNSYSTVQQLKTTTNSVSKIATGYYTSMVLKPDNTIFYWARNDMDQSEMSNLTMPAGEIPTFINGAYEHGIVIGDKGTLKITGRWIDSPGYVINTLWVPSISATTYKWAGGSQNWSIAVTSTNKVILWGTNVATSTIPSYSITSR